MDRDFSFKEFKKEIFELEKLELKEDIYINKGTLPILISAPHVLKHNARGRIKLGEPFTKAIALYLNKYFNTHVFINNKSLKDDPEYTDPNSANKHIYTDKLKEYIHKYNIGLVLDLHGAKESRDFDVDIGTLNGISADKDTVKTLVKSFNKKDISNVKLNSMFKGGKITQIICNDTNTDIIQLELNARKRMNIRKLEKVISSLILFIEEYSK